MATLVAEKPAAAAKQAASVDADVYPVSEANMNEHIRGAQYAVRGEIVLRANQLAAELASGAKLPFDKLVYCNVGNPQILGQQPMSFLRQVLALVTCPQLLADPKGRDLFPADVLARAEKLLAAMPGGTGSYTDSRGNELCRRLVADGIEARDGYPAVTDHIYMTDGASPGVHAWIKMLCRDERDCVLTPIPQYPLYSACLALYNGTLLPYYLDEKNAWALSVGELRAQVDKARSEGKHVRAVAIINPGNPTGGVLDYDNQVEIVKFCKEYGIVLMADEVYQTNIYAEGKQFHSFKKVLCDLGPEYDDVLLASFNSTSKGFFGECGRRGGYFEVVNAPEPILAQMYKLMSINLCPNTDGQVVMACIMSPPKEGEPSHGLWVAERDGILGSLKDRARMVVGKFDSLQGVACNDTEGAMYAFPRLEFPSKFVEEAARAGKSPDFVYCMRLLEATGIVTIPGSGFKQAPGTYHLRTTILPPPAEIERMCNLVVEFHNKLYAEYQ